MMISEKEREEERKKERMLVLCLKRTIERENNEQRKHFRNKLTTQEKK